MTGASARAVRAAAPRVTVVAGCYNHERFVESCLESIRAQTLQDFELLVFDDASTDGSRAVIERWFARHHLDARFFPQPVNRGVCRVLNQALATARGRYLALVSTDDLWEPDKLERHVAALEAQPDDVAMVYSDAGRIDVGGHPIAGDFIETYWPDHAPHSGDILGELTKRNFIPAMSTLLRVDALRAVGGWDETLLFEDYDMWLRLASRYRIVFVPGRVARYRVVPGSLGAELFVSRKRDVTTTHCRMALKHIRNPRLTPAQQAVWMARLLHELQVLYDVNSPEAPYFLRALARVAPTPRRILRAAGATLGVTRSRVDRVRRVLGQARPEPSRIASGSDRPVAPSIRQPSRGAGRP